MSNKIKYMLIAATAALTGCLNDPHYEGPATRNPGGDGVEVAIDLYVPGTTVTRAIGNSEENNIKTIDILVFRESGGSEKFFYRTHGSDISAASEANRNFKVYLRESASVTDVHRIVVLANLRNAVDAVADDFTDGMTKDEVLALIKFDTSAKWNVSASYTPLPMWGESTSMQAVDDDTTGDVIGAITMMRSVARIDVGLNMTGTDYAPLGLSGAFKISTVSVYNTRSKGFASPQPETTDIAGTVLYPSDTGITVNASPLTYPVDAPGYGVTGSIYVAESGNRERANEESEWTDTDDATFLIIGGYYPETGSSVSWYKINCLDSSGNMMDILRNHRYIVNITSITGVGYPSETEAINAKPVNITAEVMCLSNSDVKYAVFDDYYMLGVSDRLMTAGRRGDAYAVSFTTDYPGNWSVRISDNPDWQTPGTVPTWIGLSSAAAGSGAGTRSVAFTTQNYTGFTERTAYIHVTAGRLHNYIQVTQNTRDVITLEMEPNMGEVLFMSGLSLDPVGEQEFRLTWSPADRPLKVTTSLVSGYELNPVLLKEEINGTTLNGGSGSITIKPKPMDAAEISDNPSKIRALRIDFSVTSEFNTTVMRTVMLRQRHMGLKANPSRVYSMTGGTDTLSVFSNAPWKARLDGGNAISSLDMTKSSGTGTGGGEFIRFTMATGSNSNFKGTSYIVIESDDVPAKFDPIRIAITGYWGYPYSNDSQHLVAYPATSDPERSFGQGASYCSGLGSAWRVPSTSELQAMYYQIGKTAADRNAVKLRHDIYITSSSKPFNFYYVNMTNGQIGNNTLSSAEHYVRCIRNQ